MGDGNSARDGMEKKIGGFWKKRRNRWQELSDKIDSGREVLEELMRRQMEYQRNLEARITMESVRGTTDELLRRQMLYQKDLQERLECVRRLLADSRSVEGSQFNYLATGIKICEDLLSCARNGKPVGDLTRLHQAIKDKWQLADRFFRIPEEAACPLCGEVLSTSGCEKLEADCIWSGGHLIRYRCPRCGVIFGPLKMFALSEEEFAEDYRMHYEAYDEGDCSAAELAVFEMLNPSKGLRYLNWGCGSWSNTITELRSRGYDVWGYDPYAPVDSEFVITSSERLREMRFDGIFSHDLLEHLRDPNGFFRENLEILNSGGLLAHSTSCFEYVYEYTRFHLFFYTGGAVDEICRRHGLRLLKKAEDINTLQITCLFQSEALPAGSSATEEGLVTV